MADDAGEVATQAVEDVVVEVGLGVTIRGPDFVGGDVVDFADGGEAAGGEDGVEVVAGTLGGVFGAEGGPGVGRVNRGRFGNGGGRLGVRLGVRLWGRGRVWGRGGGRGWGGAQGWEAAANLGGGGSLVAFAPAPVAQPNLSPPFADVVGGVAGVADAGGFGEELAALGFGEGVEVGVAVAAPGDAIDEQLPVGGGGCWRCANNPFFVLSPFVFFVIGYISY